MAFVRPMTSDDLMRCQSGFFVKDSQPKDEEIEAWGCVAI